MYWTFEHQGVTKISWGQPRSIPANEVTNLKERFDVEVYSGKPINPGESVLFSMQGDSTLGFGDSIWLLTFIRAIFAQKGRRRCNFDIATSDVIGEFYSYFTPPKINYVEEYITFEKFQQYDHVLPAMYYWKDIDEQGIFRGDKSWLSIESLVERLFNLTGMKYDGLPDFGDFTDQELLYPNGDWYEKLDIKENAKYCFFQWHTSGVAKNISASENIKMIKYITETLGLEVYIIGKVKGLDKLENIPGVKNLSTKTTGLDLVTLAFNAELIVGPDSAGVHLGEAFRVPTVGIFGTLPPHYVCNKYKIPAFMFGSGFCHSKPCGYTSEMPFHLCPKGQNQQYCQVLSNIDIELFERCVEQTFKNRREYLSKENKDFYKSMKLPILMNTNEP